MSCEPGRTFYQVTPTRSCILVELVDATWRAFDLGDEKSAEAHFEECRSEWNEGRNVVFNVRRPRHRGGLGMEMFEADKVAHLELGGRADAKAHGAAVEVATTYG